MDENEKNLNVTMNVIIISLLWEECRNSLLKYLPEKLGLGSSTDKLLSHLRKGNFNHTSDSSGRTRRLNKTHAKAISAKTGVAQETLLGEDIICNQDCKNHLRQYVKTLQRLNEMEQEVKTKEQLKKLKKDMEYIKLTKDVERRKESVVQYLKEDYEKMTAATFPKNDYERMVYFVRHDQPFQLNELQRFYMDALSKIDDEKFWELLGIYKKSQLGKLKDTMRKKVTMIEAKEILAKE